jgi:hypothetical protein
MFHRLGFFIFKQIFNFFKKSTNVKFYQKIIKYITYKFKIDYGNFKVKDW